MQIDHLAIAAESLDAGSRAVEAALGVSLSPGGAHPLMGTHNRLLSLGPDLYLEVIAIDPAAPTPPHPRWFGLDDFHGAPRLVAFVARVDDLDAALAAAPKGAGRVTQLARGDFRWRMALAPSGRMPFDNAFPPLIEWQGPHPAPRLPDLGCRLTGLTITHPDATDLRAALPIDDARLRILPGTAITFAAEIATPFGPRMLA